MNKSKSTMAQQIAQAAIAFEQRRTGNNQPKSVTVVLSEGTLVITLHEALSPAERAFGRGLGSEFHLSVADRAVGTIPEARPKQCQFRRADEWESRGRIPRSEGSGPMREAHRSRSNSGNDGRKRPVV
jgi:hypothetical protein